MYYTSLVFSNKTCHENEYAMCRGLCLFLSVQILHRKKKKKCNKIHNDRPHKFTLYVNIVLNVETLYNIFVYLFINRPICKVIHQEFTSPRYFSFNYEYNKFKLLLFLR